MIDPIYPYRCYAIVLPFSVITLLPYVVFAGKCIILVRIIFLIAVVFSALRVYALWHRSWLVSGLVLSLNLVPVGINGVSIFVVNDTQRKFY